MTRLAPKLGSRYNQMIPMQQHATNIVRELRNRGFQAYLAGGCVRDMLLGVVPADYDVATDATPPEVMRIFPETYAVGAQFGVVLVPLRPTAEAPPKQVKLGSNTRTLLPSTLTTSRLPPFATTAPTPTGAILTA